MPEAPERFIRFERCFNFRDLGGYSGRDGRSVRWRRLFRSMTPQHMTEADARAVGELNIGLVIDFRGERFPHSGPVLTLGGSRLPLSPATMLREGPDYERYRVAPADEALPQLLERYGEQFAAALTAIAERPDSNVLFHCRLGKDRTGVFAALVLKLLGVDDEDVVRDYMLTGDDYTLARGLLNEVEPQENHDNEPVVVREPPSLEGIEGVLKALESRYGGAHAYFGELGVREDLIEAFVEGVVEPASDEAPHPTSGSPCRADLSRALKPM